VAEANDAFILETDLPGASEPSIALTVEDGVLTIDAEIADRNIENGRALRHEYGIGRYHRRFTIGSDIDDAGITATYENGVLTIRLPKQTQMAQRRIPIQSRA